MFLRKVLGGRCHAVKTFISYVEFLTFSSLEISTSVRTAHAKTEPPASILSDLTAAIVNLVTLAATAIQVLFCLMFHFRTYSI